MLECPAIKVIADRNFVVDRSRFFSHGELPPYQSVLVLLSLMSRESHAKEVFEAIQLNRLIPWTDVTKYLPER